MPYFTQVFRALVLVYVMLGFVFHIQGADVYLGPNSEKTKGRMILPHNCSNRDLRGAVIDINMFEDNDINGIDFGGCNLEGAYFGDENRFVGCVFNNTNLRGVYLDNASPRENEPFLSNADITGIRMYITPSQLKKTKNFKNKDISNTTIRLAEDEPKSEHEWTKTEYDFSNFNLQGCYLIGNGHITHLNNAKISNAVFEGVPYISETDRSGHINSLFPNQLYATKNYKEKNLGTVIFIFTDMKNVDLRGQTLGYFDGCNLEGADLTDAFFVTRDERTLPPFSKNNPIGVTDCKITFEQFQKTRNYKIWLDRGIPEIKKILITENNAKEYNYDNITRRRLVSVHFGCSSTEDWEGKKYTTENWHVYKAGNIFVTREIAEALEKERAGR